MKSLARLGRMLGIGVLGLAVATAGPRIVQPMGLQSAEAATLPPLAGSWLPALPNAPIVSLHITVRSVVIPGTRLVRDQYVVDAAGRGGELGIATAPVPASADAQVNVTFHTNSCEPVTSHCIPTALASTTSMTLAPGGNTFLSCSQPCRFIAVKFITRSAAGTASAGELMIKFPQ